MKNLFRTPLPLLLICFAWIGCASSGWQANDVPGPRSTPFDSHQLARNAYLEGYRSGYRAQISGQSMGIELAGGPYLYARRQGFQAGVAHARAQQSPDSAPATQIYQAQ